jgi:hypothetical protein
VNLSAPRQYTFYLAAALWLLALFANWIPALQVDMFGGLAAGYVLALIAGLILILGNTMNSM